MLSLLAPKTKETPLPWPPTKNSSRASHSQLCSHTQLPYSKATAKRAMMAPKPLPLHDNTRHQKYGNATQKLKAFFSLLFLKPTLLQINRCQSDHHRVLISPMYVPPDGRTYQLPLNTLAKNISNPYLIKPPDLSFYRKYKGHRNMSHNTTERQSVKSNVENPRTTYLFNKYITK